MDDGTIVDLGPADRPVGLEILRAAAGWDIDAVAARFGLDEVTVEQVRSVAHSLLVQCGARRVAHQDDGTPVRFSVEPSRPANEIRVPQLLPTA